MINKSTDISEAAYSAKVREICVSTATISYGVQKQNKLETDVYSSNVCVRTFVLFGLLLFVHFELLLFVFEVSLAKVSFLLSLFLFSSSFLYKRFSNSRQSADAMLFCFHTAYCSMLLCLSLGMG